MLGVRTLEGTDALILTKEFAFGRKALWAVQKVFSGMPVIVLADESTLSHEDRVFLSKLSPANRPLFLAPPAKAEQLLGAAGDLLLKAGRHALGQTFHLKGMAGVSDPEAELLKTQLRDELMLLTEQRFWKFLDLAGVGQLVTRMQDAYLTLGRSA